MTRRRAETKNSEGKHLAGLQSKSWVLLFTLIFLVLALRGAGLLSRSWGNLGMVILGRTASATPQDGDQEAAAQAEILLRRATAYAAENRSAWRGLGFALVAQGQEDEAMNAWQTAGAMGEEFIQWGDRARAAGQYQEALAWYERAAAVAEPDSGDSLYYLGRTCEGTGQWEEALRAYERAVEIGVSASTGRSSPHYHMGIIYQWRLEPRQIEAALTAYEAAIEADDFASKQQAADCHYKRGEILWWTGCDFDEVIAEFQQAIELNPGHDLAHVMLGTAYYIQYQDAAMAEVEIRQAMELSPQNKWAYLHLGDIYLQEGRTEEAATMYERALEIDAHFEAAQERLQALGPGH